MNVKTIVHLVRKSSNRKTGPIPVSTSDRSTCPQTCRFYGDKGCYAEAGYFTRMNWDKVDEGSRGTDWNAFCNTIQSLPKGQLWRHNVAGDLPHMRGLINKEALMSLVNANTGKHGFTFTHHELNAHNLEIIEQANLQGFSINVSADNLKHADELKKVAESRAPVVVVLPKDQLTNCETPDGHKVIVCPAVVRDDVTCKTCKLCARTNRTSIIGFPAHGKKVKLANSIALG